LFFKKLFSSNDSLEKVILFFLDALCHPVKKRAEDKIIVLQNDEMEPTILDCDYEVEGNSTFVIVKWYRNNDSLYQWIFGSPPSAIVSDL